MLKFKSIGSRVTSQHTRVTDQNARSTTTENYTENRIEIHNVVRLWLRNLVEIDNVGSVVPTQMQIYGFK